MSDFINDALHFVNLERNMEKQSLTLSWPWTLSRKPNFFHVNVMCTSMLSSLVAKRLSTSGNKRYANLYWGFALYIYVYLYGSNQTLSGMTFRQANDVPAYQSSLQNVEQFGRCLGKHYLRIWTLGPRPCGQQPGLFTDQSARKWHTCTLRLGRIGSVYLKSWGKQSFQTIQILISRPRKTAIQTVNMTFSNIPRLVTKSRTVRIQDG